MGLSESLKKAFETEQMYMDGYFTESDVGSDLFGIMEIGKSKASDEKFLATVDAAVDRDTIADALASHAKVYAYKTSKRIKAVYIMRKDQAGVYCNEIYRSPDLDETLREKLDNYFRFRTAKTAMNEKRGTAQFDGSPIPALTTKSKFDIGMFFVWSLLYGTPFWVSLNNPAYLCCGLPIAVAMSMKTYYKYSE
ncbi:MAG: hypothetical protein J5685_02845 [Clostridiales bacterium]|nr:hypothetical protein [Clostridiales bacterium]